MATTNVVANNSLTKPGLSDTQRQLREDTCSRILCYACTIAIALGCFATTGVGTCVCWCACVDVHVLLGMCWCACVGVHVVVCMWWCACGGVHVLVCIHMHFYVCICMCMCTKASVCMCWYVHACGDVTYAARPGTQTQHAVYSLFSSLLPHHHSPCQ